MLDGLACIKCGSLATDELISVDLQEGTLHCAACGNSYTAADVREVIGAWLAILPWIEAHPANRPDPAAVGAAR